MGYFPNGTAGMVYQQKWCDRCVHDNGGEGPMCAVWSAHLLYNYEECNNNKSILHLLIPLSNAKCLLRKNHEP